MVRGFGISGKREGYRPCGGQHRFGWREVLVSVGKGRDIGLVGDSISLGGERFGYQWEKGGI